MIVVKVGELFTLVSDFLSAGSSNVHTAQDEETVISHLSPSVIHPPVHGGTAKVLSPRRNVVESFVHVADRSATPIEESSI